MYKRFRPWERYKYNLKEGFLVLNNEKKLIDFMNHNQFELQSYLIYLIGNQKQTEREERGAILTTG